MTEMIHFVRWLVSQEKCYFLETSPEINNKRLDNNIEFIPLYFSHNFLFEFVNTNTLFVLTVWGYSVILARAPRL